MKQEPGMDAWLREAKQSPEAAQIDMYLTRNGVADRLHTVESIAFSRDFLAYPDFDPSNRKGH